MAIIAAILFILSISFFIIGLIICLKNKKIAQQNELQEQRSILKENNAKIFEDKAKALEQEANQKLWQAKQFELHHSAEQAKIDADLENAKKELNNTLSSISKAQEENKKAQDLFKQSSKEAAENYFNVLEQSYIQKEEEYKNKINDMMAAVAQCQSDLDKIRDNRAAAMDALRKEKQIKEDKKNFSLIPSLDDLSDIKELNRIRNNLKKPRILSMLIWSTYFQPIAKKKFVEILGTKEVCGIYKITNQITDECYVGQSVDIYKRWSDHVKCGLGIDAAPGNKLYKAMMDYGVENFTFELLQECSKEDLDKQEDYFISLYEADKYGYNGRKQIK